MAKVTTTKPQIAGQEIRDAREELGLTQQQLADLLGVAGLSVSRWELGASFPDAPGAVRMALEYLKIQRVLDNSELLRTLDERGAEIEAMRERLLAESTAEGHNAKTDTKVRTKAHTGNHARQRKTARR